MRVEVLVGESARGGTSMLLGLRMCCMSISVGNSRYAKLRELVIRCVVLRPQNFSKPRVGALVRKRHREKTEHVSGCAGEAGEGARQRQMTQTQTAHRQPGSIYKAEHYSLHSKEAEPC